MIVATNFLLNQMDIRLTHYHKTVTLRSYPSTKLERNHIKKRCFCIQCAQSPELRLHYAHETPPTGTRRGHPLTTRHPIPSLFLYTQRNLFGIFIKLFRNQIVFIISRLILEPNGCLFHSKSIKKMLNTI